jgi:hypothetical protein
VSTPRKPRFPVNTPANDNIKGEASPKRRLPRAEVRLPAGMPVQLVEVEVLAELLDSLPPPANDNRE